MSNTVTTRAVIELLAKNLTGPEIKELITDMSDAQAQSKRTSDGFENLRGEVSFLNDSLDLASKMWNGIGAVISGTYGVLKSAAGYAYEGGAALFHLADGAMNTIDSLDEMANQVGISAAGLQHLSVTAEGAGVSSKNITAAIRSLTGNIESAISGNKNAVASFEALGFSMDDVRAMSGNVEGAFYAVGGALGSMENGAGKTDLAMGLLGRQGTRLLPVFNDFTGSTAAATQQIRALGIGITDDLISKAGAFEAALNVMNRAVGAIPQVLGQGMMSGFTLIVQGIGNGLTTFIQRIDLPGLAASIDSTLSRIGRSIPWQAIGAQASETANKIVRWVQSAAVEANKAIDQINWNEATARAINFGNKAVDALGKAWDVVMKLGNGIAWVWDKTNRAATATAEWAQIIAGSLEETEELYLNQGQLIDSINENLAQTAGITQTNTSHTSTWWDWMNRTAAAVPPISANVSAATAATRSADQATGSWWGTLTAATQAAGTMPPPLHAAASAIGTATQGAVGLAGALAGAAAQAVNTATAAGQAAAAVASAVAAASGYQGESWTPGNGTTIWAGSPMGGSTNLTRTSGSVMANPGMNPLPGGSMGLVGISQPSAPWWGATQQTTINGVPMGNPFGQVDPWATFNATLGTATRPPTTSGGGYNSGLAEQQARIAQGLPVAYGGSSGGVSTIQPYGPPTPAPAPASGPRPVGLPGSNGGSGGSLGVPVSFMGTTVGTLNIDAGSFGDAMYQGTRSGLIPIHSSSVKGTR